ncbi:MULTISPECIES: sigma-70 family RNA polymerase sigma factor [unclassified Streptomyces]|uniref:RNA polymerase sigma factor n=1 Tax=unclassified Streptomyces TaxID=2593676 RepID=UPI000379022C|nr:MULTISPECIES: sigma-70 family RNA polymerase sigma factor [unclassified Streptomyces]MYY00932.1 sigma-70 family RNA polymerase sigma factor [Streptomyces sp. SID4913]
MRHPPATYEVAKIGEDPEAFELFYRAHVQAVLRYATRRSRDAYAASDLTADVFLAAIAAAPGYREELGSPSAWLHGIARNVVASERRRAARTWNAESRIAGRRLLDEDDIARLEERIDAERDSSALLAGMAALPAGQRAVLELVTVDGLTVPEAAAALGIKQVTARVRLHRARRALRDTLTPAPPESLPHPSSFAVEAR